MLSMPERYLKSLEYYLNYVLQFQDEMRLDSIILFGSAARNQLKVNSDLDIAIVTKDVLTDRLIRGSIRGELDGGPTGSNLIEADVVFFSVDMLKSSDARLAKYVRQDGIILWKDGDYIGDFKQLLCSSNGRL